MTAGIILTAVGKSFLATDSTVSAQQESKGWKVWVKTSYCSADRQDWIRVAEKNPTVAGGNYFMSADLIEGTMKCKRDAPFGCTFAAAMAEANSIRTYPQFVNYCCKDHSVWENNRTKEARVVKGTGDPGFSWRFVKGNLCGDAAGTRRTK